MLFNMNWETNKAREGNYQSIFDKVMPLFHCNTSVTTCDIYLYIALYEQFLPFPQYFNP